MLTRTVIASVLLGLLAATAVVVAETKPKSNAKAEDKPAAWMTNYEAAIAKAKADKKIVLADFTGSDWCGFCIKLKSEVLDTKEFKELAAKQLVLLELDFPQNKPQPDAEKQQNKKLQAQYKVRGFPTVVLIDGEGKELGRVVGYGGKDQWMGQINDILAKNAPEKPAEKPADK